MVAEWYVVLSFIFNTLVIKIVIFNSEIIRNISIMIIIIEIMRNFMR